MEPPVGSRVRVMLHTPPLTDAQLESVRSVSPRVDLVLPAAPEERQGRTDAAWLADRLAADPTTEVVFSTFLPDPWADGGGLRWAQIASAGIDQENASACWGAPGVTVTTARGIHAAAMSQWAMAMILYHAHLL